MPTWEGFLVHVLTALEDGRDWAKAALVDATADVAGVTADQRLAASASGQERFRHRIGWALSSLVRAEAVERPRRATYRITDVGRALVSDFPGGFGEPELRDIAAYRDHVPAGKTGPPTAPDEGFGGAGGALDPREQIQAGVDGFIDQDPLGLGRIYVQAKRYGAENVVGRPAVQGFVGALRGQQAHQGVFITTSSFSKEASDDARHVSASARRIDGKRLTEPMIQYRVGVHVEL